MQVFDTTVRSFAETVTEHLFTAERRLRAAVQEQERAEPGARGAGLVQISRFDARTILRALLPAVLALGRMRLATLRLRVALGAFVTALIDARDAGLIDPAIVAAVALADELAEWTAEARWRQATRNAGVGWRRPAPERLQRQGELPMRDILRQSAPDKPEQNPSRRPRRTYNPVSGQGFLLLPLPGRTRRAVPSPAESADDERRSA
jgi:hypothetical protein